MSIKQIYKIRFNAGQTIIEAVVALTAILVAIAAISVVISLSVNNSTFSKSQDQASKYAQEGIEFLREANDSGVPVPFEDPNISPIPFNQLNRDYCLNADDTLSNNGSGSGCSNVNTNGLKRSIDVTQGSCAGTSSNPGSTNTVLTQVSVTVYWSGNSCSTTTPYCHSSNLITCIQTNKTNTTL